MIRLLASWFVAAALASSLHAHAGPTWKTVPMASSGGSGSGTSDLVEAVLATNNLRSTTGSVAYYPQGISDKFNDQTGIDTVSASNTTYAAGASYYYNSSTAPIGNMTKGGGLSAAFNGVTAASSGSSAVTGGPANASFAGYNNTCGVQLAVANTVTAVKIYGPSDTNTSNVAGLLFKFQGSNNGAAWTDLYSGAFAAGTSALTSIAPTQTPFSYFRVNCNGNDSDGCYFAEVELTYTAPPTMPNIVLPSVAFTAASAPTQARIFLLHRAIDTSTINSDIKAYASRDNGTTYTQGTLISMGNYDSNTQVLMATVDLSAQPSGTLMKYKITTHNNKQQYLYGVYFRWL